MAELTNGTEGAGSHQHERRVVIEDWEHLRAAGDFATTQLQWTGMTQISRARSISSHVAPITSPVRIAVSNVISRARAATPWRPRR